MSGLILEIKGMHLISQKKGKKPLKMFKKGKKGQNIWKFGQKCTKFEKGAGDSVQLSHIINC